jgi:hypothetical protein
LASSAGESAPKANGVRLLENSTLGGARILFTIRPWPASKLVSCRVFSIKENTQMLQALGKIAALRLLARIFKAEGVRNKIDL